MRCGDGCRSTWDARGWAVLETRGAQGIQENGVLLLLESSLACMDPFRWYHTKSHLWSPEALQAPGLDSHLWSGRECCKVDGCDFPVSLESLCCYFGYCYAGKLW